MKIIKYSIAVFSFFLLVYTAVWYSTNEIPKAQYQEPSEAVIFADVKPAKLITELTGVDTDKEFVNVNFNVTNTSVNDTLKHFECSIDMNGWKECISPVTLILNNYDPKTNHTLEVRAVDTHNNIEPQPLVVFTK